MTGKNRITLITQWFPPEPADLWKELALELKLKGYDVTVVTAFPNYPKGEIYSGYKQSLFHSELFDGIKVVRLPVFPDHSRSIVRRGLSYISFTLSLLFIGSFRIPKSDLFLCYSPPLTVALATLLIAKLKRRQFILNIQDMWPETLVASGVVKENSKIINIIEFFAKRIYQQAKTLVVLSEGFKRHLDRKYGTSDKTLYIPNLTHKVHEVSSGTRDDLRVSLGFSDDDFMLLYAGNIGEAQQLDVIISAVSKLSHTSKIKLVLLGGGVLLSNLKEKVSLNSEERVLFVDRVPSSEVAKYYEAADALVLHLKSDDLFKITIPHKIISYLESGKPIVSAVSGEVNNIVDSAKVGFSCDSGDDEALFKCIMKMESLSENGRKELGQNGRAYYDAKFSRASIAQLWDECIQLALIEGKSD